MITYKVASTQDEFDQIHRLNYTTFVQEIPQHKQNEEQMLVDRFHLQNTYLIACDGPKVVGMIAVRDQRPFSLNDKLEQLDHYLPPHQSVCELRLLAVQKEYRKSRLFFGLAQHLASYCLQQKYDLAIMSGTVRQLKLYSQMGFVPFAKVVGTEEASYQPMYLTKETYNASLAGRLQPRPLDFLPGPVPISEEVAASLQSTAISHRSMSFKKTMKNVRATLCQMTAASHVQILMGTGTLANDCIAAQLRQRKEKGLILANGEFGERLIDHANRAGLDFAVLQKPWGQPFSRHEVNNIIQTEDVNWLWAVYGETSTGMLNDLDMYKEICSDSNVLLCLDVISVFGSVPLDLSNVFLASGVSGKGVGGYTGLCFVFHQEEIFPSPSVPRYLDLGLYQDAQSVPFSHSSNLLQALQTALELDLSSRYTNTKDNLILLRREIETMGLPIIVPETSALPYILTIKIPRDKSSLEIGDVMASLGFKLHYESFYLIERNWIQISVIGRDPDHISQMLESFKKVYRQT